VRLVQDGRGFLLLYKIKVITMDIGFVLQEHLAEEVGAAVAADNQARNLEKIDLENEI